MSNNSVKHVFLTGPPGIGKTTFVKKVVEVLRTNTVSISGFYTEELRDHRTRVGFDVVGFDGTHCSLARTDIPHPINRKQPKVGKYFVSLNEFEMNAIPLITKESGLIVIDEIGKMELFSNRFKQEITRLLTNTKVTIFGTIPIYRSVSFIENIRHRADVSVIEINERSRNDDSLVKEIVSSLLTSLASTGT